MKLPTRSGGRLRLRQRGLTLVEMTVTILIALFLLAGLFSMVQSTRHTYTNQTQLTQLQDSERMAMTLITDVVQSAGYFPAPQTNTAIGAFPIVGTAWPAALQVINGTAPGGNLDTLSVRFMTNGGDGILNCLGNSNTNPVGTYVTYTNTFRLSAPDASGNRYLQCTLDDGSAGPFTPTNLVYGVQSMHVFYGVHRAATTDNNVDTYLVATDMAATDWQNVTAVRVVLTFNNPLIAPSSKVVQDKTITFDRVIAVMNRAGEASST